MVLAPQPKRRPSTHQKKRAGQHHKPTKRYLKTYWPYLPIIVGGAFVNVVADIATRSSSFTTVASVSQVSRLELWTGASPWTAVMVALVTFACVAIIVLRHAHAWHRVLVKSEDFFIRHHKADLVLAILATSGFILTRGATGL